MDLEEVIIVTDRALSQIKKACEDEKVPLELRIYVQGGGCAGYQYVLDFEKPFREGKTTGLSDEEKGKWLTQYGDHLVFEKEEIKIYIDPMSLMHLEGITLDYITTLGGGGFKFNNPNAKSTCGCGSSFG